MFHNVSQDEKPQKNSDRVIGPSKAFLGGASHGHRASRGVSSQGSRRPMPLCCSSTTAIESECMHSYRMSAYRCYVKYPHIPLPFAFCALPTASSPSSPNRPP